MVSSNTRMPRRRSPVSTKIFYLCIEAQQSGRWNFCCLELLQNMSVRCMDVV
jgi:hypothetical protein